MISQQKQAGGAEKTDALPTGGHLEPELQDHIGMQLRAEFNEILNAPVPDRFVQLLAELEKRRGEES